MRWDRREIVLRHIANPEILRIVTGLVRDRRRVLPDFWLHPDWLLMLPPNQLVQIALALVVVMMVANALWNLIFFRARNLYIAFVTGSAAPVPDVLLFISLWRLDPLAALALSHI